MTPPQIAVLTGDLVNSTRQTPDRIDAAMQAISHAAQIIATWQTPARDTHFTRFRGDGWQIVVFAPRLSLRAAVVLQGTLGALGLESRISIGIGTVDTIGTSNLSDAAGRAFELSGQALDKMAETARLAISGDTVIAQDAMLADLLGERMGRWTAAQAQAAAMQLSSPSHPPTLQEIGKHLGISAQAVNDRTRGAGCPAIASVLRRWEAVKVRDGREDTP